MKEPARDTASSRSRGPTTRRARALHRGARRHARARRAALGGGLRDPVDARREPGQVAPRAHHVVLRDLHPRRHDRGAQPFHPAFRVLFNSYYNAVGDKHPRPQRGLLSRPSLEEVLAYRDARRAEMVALLAAGALDAELPALVELGIQHEQQHQELILTDMKHMLSCNPLRPAYQQELAAHADPAAARRAGCAWPGGAQRDRPRRRGLQLRQRDAAPHAWVHDFEIASHPVTHGDFHRLHRRRRLSAPRALALRGLGRGHDARLGSAALLGAARRPLAHLHAARHGARRAQHAGVPRELLRGRRVRALVERAPADGSRMGSGGGRRARRRQLRRKRRVAPGVERIARSATTWWSTASRYASTSSSEGATGGRVRARMLVAHRVVVRIEEHAERRVERRARGSWRSRMKVSKNHVVCARCHLTGLASGIDWIAQSSAESGAASARVAPRTAMKRAARERRRDGRALRGARDRFLHRFSSRRSQPPPHSTWTSARRRHLADHAAAPNPSDRKIPKTCPPPGRAGHEQAAARLRVGEEGLLRVSYRRQAAPRHSPPSYDPRRPWQFPRAAKSSAPARSGNLCQSCTGGDLRALAISSGWPRRPNPVTSVSAWTPAIRRARARSIELRGRSDHRLVPASSTGPSSARR